jgi:DNA polymerase
MSQDKQWAFICEISTPAGRMDIDLQGTLFNNILHALSIEKYSKMQLTNVADVQASMVVAMGESVAQALLNTQQPLETLRGKLHPVGHTQLLATCDLAHLLNNPLDKAKVWQDLCLARSYLQGLQVQD